MLPALIPIALSLAPLLAKWVGGRDAGAVAAEVATAARSVVGTDDPSEVAAQIEADPAKRGELAVELSRIAAAREEEEHRQRVRELEIAAQDRADARQMARVGALAWGASLVTGAAFLLLAGTLGVLAFVEVPAGSREVLLMLAGVVAAMAKDGASFWLGSSASSAGKSGLLHRPLAASQGK